MGFRKRQKLIAAGPLILKLLKAVGDGIAGIIARSRDDFRRLLDCVAAEHAVVVGKVMIDSNLAVVHGSGPRESVVGVRRRVQREKVSNGAAGEADRVSNVGVTRAVHGHAAGRSFSHTRGTDGVGGDRNPLRFPQPLVNSPEERLILPDRSAEGASEVVALILWISPPSLHVGIIKEISRIQHPVAYVFKDVTVELVGAALADDGHLAPD